MLQKRDNRSLPTGLKRLLFRAPIWFYRLGLGGLLGERFLLLNHIGRNSGLRRQTVLEVVGRDGETGAYLVASGFGRKADWHRNILKSAHVTIEIGGKKMAAMAVPLSRADSGSAMVDYARRHPKAARQLMTLCGHNVGDSEDDYYTIGQDDIPFIALMPI